MQHVRHKLRIQGIQKLVIAIYAASWRVHSSAHTRVIAFQWVEIPATHAELELRLAQKRCAMSKVQWA